MEYAVGSTSLAHTFGNVTSFVTEYVKTLFPKDYFRTVHVSSTIAYRQLSSLTNLNKEFIKKSKPMLIIKPRLEFDDGDVFMSGTYITSRILDNMLGDIDVGNLQIFINDDRHQDRCAIKFLLNRFRVSFDISVVVETQVEQFNTANFFRNMVRIDRPFMLNTALESHIPRPILEAISKNVEIPIYDDNKSVRPFLEYLNTHSAYPVTYKFKNSTGNDEFFRFYSANLDTIISNFSIDDGNKKGMVADAHSINFSISTEFFTSGLYYFFTYNKDILKEVNGELRTDDPLDKPTSMIPLFTVSNLYNETLPNGWKMYTTNLYKIEDGDNILDIKPVFSMSLLKLIEHHISNGIPIETFIDIKVMKDSRMLLREMDHYNINYTNMTLTTNVVNMYSTYRLMIYVNTLYINEMVSEVLELKKED